MGLMDGIHLELVGELDEPNKYRAGGWLSKEGFAGQVNYCCCYCFF
jgi:hypothetical protein